MNDKPTLQELLEVQEHFGLPSPGLVEKDWYVVKALAAIAAVDTGDFRLVFGGRHGAEPRLQAHQAHVGGCRSQDRVRCTAVARRALRKLRSDVTDALLAADFVFDPENEQHRVSMYRGHYTRYQLPYTPLAQGKGLRPSVQIETSVWPLRRDAIDKPVISFVAEAYGRAAELPKIACSSLLETAAEKFVALTWRAGSALAGLRKERDPTLVRHIYDLHMIRDQHDAAETAALAHEVMKADAQTRGDRFRAWQRDLVGETLRAIDGIPKDKVFVDGYMEFLRDMVYGEKPDFATAMATLKSLAEQLRRLPK